MRTFSRALLGCFYAMASLSFVYVFFMAFFWNREEPFALMVGFSVFFAALMGFFAFLSRQKQLFSTLCENTRLRRGLVLGLLLLFALLQIYFSHELMVDNSQEVWDIWAVRQSAAFVAEHPFAPEVEHIAYFQRFENNQFVLTLVSLWFLLCRGLFGAGDYEVFGAALNLISLTGSMGLSYLAAKRFFGLKNALFSLGLWFLFLPFYSYAPIYYTDTLCLPFITLSAYFLSRFLQSRRPVFAALAGVFMGLGGQMKGTLYVFLIAGVLWLLFVPGVGFRRRMLSLALCCGCVLLSIGSFRLFYEKSGLFGDKPSDHEGMAVPITHYLSMAQSPNGPYDIEDRNKVIEMGNTYAYRSKQCWDDFYGRLVTRGLWTDLVFTNKKVVAVWGEGSYQTNQYHRDYVYHPDSVWFRNFNPDEPASAPWFLFMNSFHFVLLFCLLGSLLRRLVRGQFAADGLFLYQLALFGMFLFELFWEWRSRYLLGYVPFLIAMVPLGLDAWLAALRRIGRKGRSVLIQSKKSM